ncbi:hypothetical protein ACN9U4_13280 [Staphylococcus caprae]|uniref:hypothetical protein n=1 Tax=Staphylococcus caprae TaxID=29380 RepID=UPI003B212863
MENAKGKIIVSAIMLVVFLATTGYLIFHAHQFFPSLIFLGLAFFNGIRCYLSYQKMKERD